MSARTVDGFIEKCVAKEYQERMVAAHDLLASLNATQAALYKFWKFPKNWDGQGLIHETTMKVYDAISDAVDQVKQGVAVAHYG